MNKIDIKRSQTAVEFVLIFAFVLFFFVIFFAIIQDNVEDKNLDKERIIAQNIALDVQNEISLAAGSSEGYHREFNVPLNILGKEYDINITDADMVYLHIPDRVGVAYSVINVTGDVRRGINVIRKEGGVVYLN
ncbi:MAG: hypothetical protein ABIB79_05065 [archaeon]